MSVDAWTTMGDDAHLTLTRDEYAGTSILIYDDGLGGAPRAIAASPPGCHPQFLLWLAQSVAAHHDIPLHTHPSPGPYTEDETARMSEATG